MRLVITVLLIVLGGCASTLNKEDSSGVQLYINEVKSFPLNFTITKSEEKEAWERAQSIIARYSSMPIQTLTEYAIQTKEPERNTAKYGYHVSKSTKGENVHITVICSCGKRLLIQSTVMNARILAYYIKTGKLPYPELITK